MRAMTDEQLAEYLVEHAEELEAPDGDYHKHAERFALGWLRQEVEERAKREQRGKRQNMTARWTRSKFWTNIAGTTQKTFVRAAPLNRARETLTRPPMGAE